LHRNDGKIALTDDLTPLCLLAAPTTSHEIVGEGIYIGIDLDSGSELYWNMLNSPSPHAIVIGPTGSGKTITLMTLAQRIAKTYNASILVIDVKGEYKILLKGLVDRVSVFNPLSKPIDICNRTLMNILVELLQAILHLNEGSRRFLAEVIKTSCNSSSLASTLRSIPVSNIDELGKALEILQLFFESREGVDLFTMLKETLKPRSALVIELGTPVHYDYVAIIPLFFISATLTPQALSTIFNHSTIKLVLVLDEAWLYIPHTTRSIITKVLRLARSYGVSILMATQSLEDLGEYKDLILSNCGLLIALASNVKSYWMELAKYLNLSPKLINRALELQEKGEGVALLAPSKTPRFVYVDPLSSEELELLVKKLHRE